MARLHFSGLVASAIANLVNGRSPPAGFLPAFANEHQQNGAHGAHQLRLCMEGDPTVYRVIVAPADAPITVGGVPVDQHFSYPIGTMPDAVENPFGRITE